MTIKEFMARDHKDCDLLFASAENEASRANWEKAAQAFNAFINAMERHLGVEEEELFPAFEAETGVAMGPTEMMRMEHDQMRALFVEMRDALDNKHTDDYLSVSDTLLVLMQQHNIKEEQILYTIMDQRLTEDSSNWQQKYQEWNKT